VSVKVTGVRFWLWQSPDTKLFLCLLPKLAGRMRTPCWSFVFHWLIHSGLTFPSVRSKSRCSACTPVSIRSSRDSKREALNVCNCKAWFC
jgi:hypothetical protein